MTNTPFTGCWHRRWKASVRKEVQQTPDGMRMLDVTVATCRDCGQTTETFRDGQPDFPLPPRQFAVVSSDPCPECAGRGTWEADFRTLRPCRACRGTGGVLVSLVEALKELNFS